MNGEAVGIVILAIGLFSVWSVGVTMMMQNMLTRISNLEAVLTAHKLKEHAP